MTRTRREAVNRVNQAAKRRRPRVEIPRSAENRGRWPQVVETGHLLGRTVVEGKRRVFLRYREIPVSLTGAIAGGSRGEPGRRKVVRHSLPSREVMVGRKERVGLRGRPGVKRLQTMSGEYLRDDQCVQRGIGGRLRRTVH